ncbi:glycerophosphodiester phosphodiesterase [Pseudolysinimonas yzui]|uniref:Glycerophosphoryl diester phosphodiesterase n=1 Tax=Pseudolysinimonas yzui TaxID=2708254 RepID=A0A8J3GTD8_9MICO|nr:glycerophosphodiester phosphodiesterase family protein [Pseudolysinimonas yzui]GHF26075.1 glycerophosphoryl diester phosphodiesterase [Pseudolysinimonas yzui]
MTTMSLAVRADRHLLRVSAAALVTIASVAVLVLAPGATQAYAANLMGPLRAPGEPAFIAAHRGDRASAPENTVPAFEAAVAGGADFVEVDVQLTVDGYPVIIHDATVDRTTTGTGAVADLTLAEIRTLDAGSWFAPQFAGVQVPMWGEFLDILTRAPEVTALVELKHTWATDDIENLMGGIYFRGLQDRIVFASFSTATVTALQETAPVIPRVLIRRVLPLDPVAVAQRYDAIAIMTRSSALTERPDAVGEMHAAGLGLLLYTLNNEERWVEALGYGVDGIVTDKPSALDAWIAQTAPGT